MMISKTINRHKASRRQVYSRASNHSYKGTSSEMYVLAEYIDYVKFSDFAMQSPLSPVIAQIAQVLGYRI